MLRKQPSQYFGFLGQRRWPNRPSTSPPTPLKGAAHNLQWGELGIRVKTRRRRTCGNWLVSIARHRSSFGRAGTGTSIASTIDPDDSPSSLALFGSADRQRLQRLQGLGDLLGRVLVVLELARAVAIVR